MMADWGDVICGDSLAVLRGIGDESCQLCITSPPYYRQKDYGHARQHGHEHAVDEYVAGMRAVLRELRRITKKQGACFVVIGDTFQPCGRGSLLLVPHRVLLAASEEGWVVRNDIIWSKSDPAPDGARNRWRTSHEHIFFLVKNAKDYTFNDLEVRVPYAEGTLKRWGKGQKYGGEKSRRRTNRGDVRLKHGKTFSLHPVGCLPSDVWVHHSSQSRAQHYATFPSGLIEPMILACSHPGDIVCDPFCGTGTTGAVAVRLRRRFLGIELNPTYADYARTSVGEAACCCRMNGESSCAAHA